MKWSSIYMSVFMLMFMVFSGCSLNNRGIVSDHVVIDEWIEAALEDNISSEVIAEGLELRKITIQEFRFGGKIVPEAYIFILISRSETPRDIEFAGEKMWINLSKKRGCFTEDSNRRFDADVFAHNSVFKISFGPCKLEEYSPFRI